MSAANPEHHDYELYLAVEDIDHSRTKTKSPQTNGIVERFHKTVLDEFYRVVFRKKIYPDGLIRTVKRRVKIWRGDMARALVFGANGDAPPPMTPAALRNMEASRDRGHRETPAAGGHESKNLGEQLAEATT